MKVITPVYPCEAPVEACLVFVVAGAVFGKLATAIGGHDGVEVGAEIFTGVLHQDGFAFASAENRESSGGCILRYAEDACIPGGL